MVGLVFTEFWKPSLPRFLFFILFGIITSANRTQLAKIKDRISITPSLVTHWVFKILECSMCITHCAERRAMLE